MPRDDLIRMASPWCAAFVSPKTSQLAVTLVRELPRLGLSLLGVLVAYLFEHFVVHRLVVLPSMEADGSVPPWLWVGLVAPELLVGFATGWRLRSRAAAVMFAGMAALVRESCQLVLAATGEPGHLVGAHPVADLATSTPVVATAYLIAILLASSLAREEESIDARGRAASERRVAPPWTAVPRTGASAGANEAATDNDR